jgi:hypothetical protein
MKIFQLMLFYFLIFLNLSSAQAPQLAWKTGQVIAISQREAEPATMIFEFVTGSRYGHVGLVVVEEGIPWVFEATHPEVKKTSLEDFFQTVAINQNGEKEFTILEPMRTLSTNEELTIKSFAKQHVNLRTKYNYSGVKNAGKLNCSEFIHEAYKTIGQSQVGAYQPARELNLNSLNGLIKKLWGKRTIPRESQILSPFSIVKSPSLRVVQSTLSFERVLSDRELYLQWVNSVSFQKFKERFMLTDLDLLAMERELSSTPQAKVPLYCGMNFL